MLKIKDLSACKELDAARMSAVVGGHRRHPLFDLDASTSMDNKVADVSQLFALGLSETNAGAVTNNQMISNGNGITYAPVTQRLDQNNWMGVFDLGKTLIR